LLAEHEGRVDEALHLTRKALAHFSELGDERDLARLKVASASVMLAAEPPLLEETRDALDRAKPELIRLGSELDLVEWEHLRSTVALLEGDLTTAEEMALEAIRRLPEAAGSEHLALAHRALADVSIASERAREALEHYAVTADLLEVTATGRGGALLWRDLAERLLAVGETDRAIRALRRALDTAGVRNRARSVVEAIGQRQTSQSAGQSPRETHVSALPEASALPEL
jgi:tetratricopeptide (TPR) repeat protein